MRLLLTSFALLAACSSAGTVTLDDKAADDTGAPEDTAADDSAAPEDSPEPEVNAWAGDYEGEVNVFVPEWEWDFCQGELALEVDEEGGLSGEGLCTQESNWGAFDMDVTVEGVVSEDGEITGEIIVYVPGWDGGVTEYPGELEGEGDGDELSFTWTVEVQSWGGTTDAEGEVVAERR